MGSRSIDLEGGNGWIEHFLAVRFLSQFETIANQIFIQNAIGGSSNMPTFQKDWIAQKRIGSGSVKPQIYSGVDTQDFRTEFGYGSEITARAIRVLL